jgi:HK97 family phage prohead protease
MNLTAEIRERMALGTASDRDLEGIDLAVARDVRRDLEVLVRAAMSERVKAVDDDGRMRADYVFSDETPDRYGDVVSVGGWELDEFRSNPIILWQHSPWEPVGRCVDVRVEEVDGRQALVGTVEFADPGTSEIADATRELVRQGILKAVSVGFNIVDAQVPSEKVAEALGIGQYGLWITRARLLEVSLVSIPANPNALERELRAAGVSDMACRLARSAPSASDVLARAAKTVVRSPRTGDDPAAGPGTAPEQGGDSDPMARAAAQIAASAAQIEAAAHRIERAMSTTEGGKSAPVDEPDTVDEGAVRELAERLDRRTRELTAGK